MPASPPPSVSTSLSSADCVRDPLLQASRSRELEDIFDEDQNARKGFSQMTQDQRAAINLDDTRRRERVAAIFSEGCFVSGRDFAIGALVFQHGSVPDHYLLAFTWAKRATELGDESAKSLVAVTIDRYLTSTGHAQLFGSQATRAKGSDCWCMPRVEETFPDDLRRQYTGMSLADKRDWVVSKNAGKQCSSAPCDTSLAPTPRGTVPGFW